MLMISEEREGNDLDTQESASHFRILEEPH